MLLKLYAIKNCTVFSIKIFVGRSLGRRTAEMFSNDFSSLRAKGVTNAVRFPARPVLPIDRTTWWPAKMIKHDSRRRSRHGARNEASDLASD